MKKKQAVVLDVGSSKISAYIGERSINNTFLIKGQSSVEYEGFCDGAFIDEEQFDESVRLLIENVSKFSHDPIDTVYVGIPGAFTSVIVRESQISFPKKRKIDNSDIDTLYDSAFVLSSSSSTLISRSAIYYELDDFRRINNPIGYISETLKGKLSFIVCDNYFIEKIVKPLKEEKVITVKCIPTAFAEGMYLVDASVRDRIALVLDVGYISSTLAVIQGGGILYQKSFPFGGGIITGSIANKYDLDFNVAETVKRKVNLCSSSNGKGYYNVIDAENGEYYPSEEIKSIVINCIDDLCEQIFDALEEFKITLPEYVSLMITGGGISYLRGAKERVCERLGLSVDILKPTVPLMDKPVCSSYLSLLDIALR
ncbi:MAG: pilus assembly protein PilM [Clostridia bacterium]|nr:pilus assembly protein PilM [Clostridia bacterium]